MRGSWPEIGHNDRWTLNRTATQNGVTSYPEQEITGSLQSLQLRLGHALRAHHPRQGTEFAGPQAGAQVASQRLAAAQRRGARLFGPSRRRRHRRGVCPADWWSYCNSGASGTTLLISARNLSPTFIIPWYLVSALSLSKTG